MDITLGCLPGKRGLSPRRIAKNNIESIYMTNENKIPTLSTEDLNNIKAIIDAASTRGVFRAGEMFAVGQLYNKINVILEADTK